MRKLLMIALVAIACHRGESPTAPDCQPVMGALGNAQISGFVITGGKPAAKAYVRLVSSSYAGNAWGMTTDANGFFYEGDMWTGSYIDSVTLAGRQQPSKTDRITLGCGSNQITIVVPAGA